MATIAQCIAAEHKLRELIEQEGLPDPDEVEYDATCIRFFWTKTKVVVVVDIDPPEEASLEPAQRRSTPQADPESN